MTMGMTEIIEYAFIALIIVAFGVFVWKTK